uniref:Uncharacterized protein n=1 Tax=Globodera rostochiensis TaxID=31243 RepID=A0A914GZH5_GLORO
MQNRQTMMKPKTTATANFSADDDDDVMFVPVQPSTSANDSETDELSEWKGRALFLEQSVKGLEMENKELRHELGRTKNELMRLQKECEQACQERDREINRRRTIKQFEEEERRAHAIASASLADPVPLTADERGRQELMKRIGPPMRRVTVSAVAQSHSAHRTPATVGDAGTSTAAATTTTAVERVQHQQQGRHTFPSALSVFGEYMPTPRRRYYRRIGAAVTSDGTRWAPSSSSVSDISPMKRNAPQS